MIISDVIYCRDEFSIKIFIDEPRNWNFNIELTKVVSTFM